MKKQNQTTEQKIKNLILRYVDLRITGSKRHSRLIDNAIDRIQQEYCILTEGNLIDDNPEVKRLINEKMKASEIH
jgi:hypothetical protein